MWIPLIAAFFAGALTVAFAEAFFVFFLIRRLLRSPSTRSASDLASVAFQTSGISFQGQLWIATLPTSVRRNEILKQLAQNEKFMKDQKRKKKKTDSSDVLDTCPSQRSARLENNMLFLVSEDGAEESINLKGCSIHAISAGNEISRKWQNKYPIQIKSVEGKELLGSSLCLLYFETGWEKETWCQVLRAASRWSGENDEYYMGYKREFHEYSLKLEKAYPAFSKFNPSRLNNLEDETAKIENSDAVENLNKRQRLWRKVAKKGSFLKERSGSTDLKTRLLESKSMSKGFDKHPSLSSESSMEGSSSHSTMGSIGGHQGFAMQETDDTSDSSKSIERIASHTPHMADFNQQGPICFNILCSRLFFDAYHSKAFQATCRRWIQKQLSKIVSSGYMGKTNCVDLDLGMLPPYFHSFHSICKDSSFVWSFDSTVEYSGGAAITIETHINAHEFISQENIGGQNQESPLFEDDVLKAAIEHIEKDAVSTDARNMDSNNATSQPTKGNWRSVLLRIADQVSMVPITLSLRLMSLKGTVRVRIKPPPTDRIWFGFTAPPVIDLRPEASIGDRKITNRPIEAFIVNKIKMLIQEKIVLPNSEGIWVPWMISEMDDWIPRPDMPAPCNHTSLPRVDMNDPATQEKVSSGDRAVASNDAGALLRIGSKRVHDSPLPETSQSLSFKSEIGDSNKEYQSSSSISEDTAVYEKGNSSSKHAKMRNFGKKVTEKLEVKGRMMVEKVLEHTGRGEEQKKD